MIFDESIPVGFIRLSDFVMQTLKACENDLVSMEDSRWLLGGLRAEYVKALACPECSDQEVKMNKETFDDAYFLPGKLVTLEKIV